MYKVALTLSLLPFVFAWGMKASQTGPAQGEIKSLKNNMLNGDTFGKQLLYGCQDRFQIAVANQMAILESRLDCGYHALFNGFALAELAQACSQVEQQTILNQLLDLTLKKQELFGSKESSWKKKIIASRAREKITPEITYYLTRMLKNTQVYAEEKDGQTFPLYAQNSFKEHKICFGFEAKDKKERLLLASYFLVIKEAAQLLTDSIKIELAIMDSIKLTSFEVKTALLSALEIKALKALKAKKPDYDQIEAYEALQHQNKLLEKFDIQDIEFGLSIDTKEVFGSEIRSLYQDESFQEIFPNAKHAKFLILGADGAQSLDAQDDSYDSEEFKAFQKTFLEETGNAIGVIILNINMGKDGHWVPIVINKVGNERQFLITDSNKNLNRIRDSRVNKVIQLVGGKELPAEENNSLSSFFTFDTNFIKKSILSIIVVGALYLLYLECRDPKKKKKLQK